MENFEQIFGKVIRRHRERQGHSQEGFASLAGVHRTYMSSIERGKVQVSIRIAQDLAVALDVPLSKVFREVEKELVDAKGAAP
ncbi:helix-turn-helix domain-containing protein [Rubinisphaera margarita]|uniref:helix-turn-helix domain-containing protein n=1 Tax=Rubinisphaera margarita TaxID=2909586 RepID=UPI001EE83B3B|nr:helix-turn-helix transcriptional regulator [Rubinisphaera margarita]MCG6157630.1 helix-turn-helix domain-containing protein [Rubinisphaera margarita]